MIISTSHTLEYKPNDIIITSSIGDVLLHHPKYHRDYTSFVPRLHLQRFGRWSLGANLDPGTSAPAHGLHHVTVSRGQIMAPALACARMRASLSRCVIARAVRSPEKGIDLEVYTAQGPRRLRPVTSRYGTRFLPVALSYADLQSHARESEIA